MTYRVFVRSCRNWKEFASARKTTLERGVSYERAMKLCETYNAARTARQVRRGTKAEFESEV